MLKEASIRYPLTEWLEVNYDTFDVWVNNQSVRVNFREFQILQILSQDHICSPDEIVETLNTNAASLKQSINSLSSDEKALLPPSYLMIDKKTLEPIRPQCIRQTINTLNRKLGYQIQTISRQGYRLA